MGIEDETGTYLKRGLCPRWELEEEEEEEWRLRCHFQDLRYWVLEGFEGLSPLECSFWVELGLGLYILESVSAADREECEHENDNFRITFKWAGNYSRCYLNFCEREPYQMLGRAGCPTINLYILKSCIQIQHNLMRQNLFETQQLVCIRETNVVAGMLAKECFRTFRWYYWYRGLSFS